MDISKKINLIAEEFFKGNNVSFAKRMGTSEANIRNYRKNVPPKIDFLVTMCNELEISFDWLFNSVGPMLRSKESELTLVAESKPENEYRVVGDINRDETIKALHKVIAAQDRTIQALEDLLASKSPGKAARSGNPVGTT